MLAGIMLELKVRREPGGRRNAGMMVRISVSMSGDTPVGVAMASDFNLYLTGFENPLLNEAARGEYGSTYKPPNMVWRSGM